MSRANNFTKWTWPIILTYIVLAFGIQLITKREKEFDYCICQDGSTSNSKGSGACSWHGGVKKKVYAYGDHDFSIRSIFVSLLIACFIGLFLGILTIILVGMILNRN